MSTATPEIKTSRKVTAFFREVDELSRQVGEVRQFTRRMPHTKRQANSYARKLQKLESRIHQLRTEIVPDEPGVAPPPVVRRSADAPAGQPAADAIRTRLVQMIQAGQLLASTDFLSRLGLTKQALSKAVGANRMFYIDFRGDRHFPAFYVDPMYSRAQLETVTKLLGDLPGGAKLQFFMTRKGSLAGLTPLEAIAQGKLAKVKDVAAAFADQR